jgi:hypothetical protein
MCPSYVAPGVKTNVPYVYFDSGTWSSVNSAGGKRFPYGAPLSWDPQNASGSLVPMGVAMVYFNDDNQNGIAENPSLVNGSTLDEDWANRDSFQIVAPGLDGRFGSNPTEDSNVLTKLRVYPGGKGYSTAGLDDDNVTNFCVKARLGDAKP